MQDKTMNKSTPNNDAVRCQGISKDFGDGASTTRVLHDIDIGFQAGAMSMLVGHAVMQGASWQK